MKTQTSNPKRTYDHRLRGLVYETGDIDIALQLGVPRSTAVGWLASPPRPIISHEFFDQTDMEVRAQILRLEKQVAVLIGIMQLLLRVIRLFEGRLNWERLPQGDAKRAVLRAIDHARQALPLRAVLTIIGLSSTRYHKWIQAAENDCPLNDLSSCPNSHPTQLLVLHSFSVEFRPHAANFHSAAWYQFR